MSLFSGPSWIQLYEKQHGGKTDGFTYRENKAVLFWPDNFSTKR